MRLDLVNGPYELSHSLSYTTTLTPSELAHLIRLLGGPLEGAPEFKATDVIALRMKLEACRG